MDDAVDAATRAIEMWRAAGDVEREAVVTARRAHMLRNAGRIVESRESARAAMGRVPLPG